VLTATLDQTLDDGFGCIVQLDEFDAHAAGLFGPVARIALPNDATNALHHSLVFGDLDLELE